MSTKNGRPPASPTLTYATPEEIVEFVERIRFRHPPESGVLPTQTIVAVESPPVTRPKCEWESCPDASTAQYRWRIEAADGVNDKFNNATYCDGHGGMASTHGAVLVERFT